MTITRNTLSDDHRFEHKLLIKNYFIVYAVYTQFLPIYCFNVFYEYYSYTLSLYTRNHRKFFWIIKYDNSVTILTRQMFRERKTKIKEILWCTIFIIKLIWAIINLRLIEIFFVDVVIVTNDIVMREFYQSCHSGALWEMSIQL